MPHKNGKRTGSVREKDLKKERRGSKVPEANGNCISAADLAGLLSDPPFSDRWLRELTDRGYLVKLGRAQYDLKKSVLGYLQFVRETDVKVADTESNSRAAFEAERARKLKLENDTRETKLIETQLAVDAIDAIVGIYQTEVHSIPARITADVWQRRQWEIEIDRVSDAIAARHDKAISRIEAGQSPLDKTADDDL